MDILWELHPLTVRDVKARLGARSAYTTVMTTVTRLYEKGILERERDGKRYLYSPKLAREEFMESTAREVLDEAVGGHKAMVMLAEKVSEASAGELDDLEALIQKRREELDA